jgi:hypothetical protein
MEFSSQFADWVEWTKQNLPQTDDLPSISTEHSAFAAPWMPVIGWSRSAMLFLKRSCDQSSLS